MIEFSGVFTAKTGLVLNSGELYPKGKHLRGACGYISLYNNLSIKHIFTDENNEDIMFFDLLPYCNCNNLFFKQCSKCGMDIANYLVSVKTVNRTYKELRENIKFRLKIIAKDEVADNVISLLKEIKDKGIYVGKYRSEGKGKLTLIDYKFNKANPISSEKGRLVSDAITPNGTKDVIFSKTIIDEKQNIQFKEIRCKAIPVGSLVELKNNKTFNGFAIGQYKGLGFGEVIKA